MMRRFSAANAGSKSSGRVGVTAWGKRLRRRCSKIYAMDKTLRYPQLRKAGYPLVIDHRATTPSSSWCVREYRLSAAQITRSDAILSGR